MSQFYEMEWNSKWDWENFFGFGPKSIESPKKLQLVDWEIVDDGEIDGGSFNLFGGGGDSGASGSDGGRGSSAKSSISASTDSSIKDRFSKSEGSFGNFSKNPEMKGSNKEASIGSAEALIGLKLGKRTYFENSNGGVVVKSASFSAISTPATKKTKSSCQNSNICCQVLGCNADLSAAKEYHRKHRVCDNHSKCPKVIVGGVERRFCQQCSRFHCLSEFDEKKRSCRRRLSDHNARRRKPQQETVQFNSTRFSSPFCGGNQEMSFLLSNTPLVHSRTPESFAWDRACNSKFTLTKGCPFKSYGDGGTDEPMHMPGIKLPRAIYMQNGDNGLSATKNPTSEILDPGSKGSMISSVDEAPEYSRSALSLLSSDSRHQESAPLSHPILQTQAIPDSMPLSSSEFWLAGQHSAHSHFQSLPTNSNFQEIQLFKAPYDADFYSNIY